MSQSLTKIYLHIVFSTKERRPLLQEPQVRERLHIYLKGICDRRESPSLCVGGVADHIHIACRLSKNLDVSKLVAELKKGSSTWIKREFPNTDGFYWQSGYGAFSISPAHVPTLTEYIHRQEEHHRRESFRDEYLRLLRKYEVDFDERYVWD